MRFGFIFFSLTLFSIGLSNAEPNAPASANDYPVFVAKAPNPNDYNLFANGGWDGNWYVGYNTCWVKKLPLVPAGEYVRAYLGTKLGRMKLSTNTKNVWDKKPLPGSIYMAVSSTSAWSRERSFLVANAEQIPLEGDFESAVEGTGESQWFWTEVPLHLINKVGDNYLALWSPTPEFISVSSSPVLAAAWGGKEQDTWLTRDIRGAPPRTPETGLGTPISYFQPAMALKLIRTGPAHPLTVSVVDWKNYASTPPKSVITARVMGEGVQRVWLEYSADRSAEPRWSPIGRTLWKAPYIVSVDHTKLPSGRLQLRVVANNLWEENAASEPFSVEVSTGHERH